MTEQRFESGLSKSRASACSTESLVIRGPRMGAWSCSSQCLMLTTGHLPSFQTLAPCIHLSHLSICPFGSRMHFYGHFLHHANSLTELQIAIALLLKHACLFVCFIELSTQYLYLKLFLISYCTRQVQELPR
jgi:hypothetical protein